jgi:hypothetical protein
MEPDAEVAVAHLSPALEWPLLQPTTAIAAAARSATPRHFLVTIALI